VCFIDSFQINAIVLKIVPEAKGIKIVLQKNIPKEVKHFGQTKIKLLWASWFAEFFCSSKFFKFLIEQKISYLRNSSL